MNKDMHERLEGIAGELIRRGLPIDYSHRAAAELEDHRCDLVEELRSAGLNEADATAGAWQRLGDTKTLVRRTIRAYQRRFWCGRWPLITFLLAPIPALIAVWVALAYGLWFAVSILISLGTLTANEADAAMAMLPVQVKFACLATAFLVVPAMVMYCFTRLAKRAALSWPWVLLVACVLGLFMGAWKWERIGPGSRLVMRDRQTLEQLQHPPHHDFVLVLWMPINANAWTWTELRGHFFSNLVQPCQLLMPVAVSGLLLFRYRNLARRAERRAFGSC